MTDILGTEDADALVGTPGSERIDGRGGDDTIRAGGGRDTVAGGAGDDRIFLSDLVLGIEVDAGAGDDLIDFGSPGAASVLDGGEGDDTLIVADDRFSLHPILADDPAAAGFELVVRSASNFYERVTSVVRGVEQVSEGFIFDDYNPRAFDVRLADAGGSSLTGTGARGLFAVGGAGDDTIEGTFGASADGLWGGAGDDLIVTAGGGTLRGGLGADTLRAGEAAAITWFEAGDLAELEGDEIDGFGGRDEVRIASDRALYLQLWTSEGDLTRFVAFDGFGGSATFYLTGDRTGNAFRLVNEDGVARLLLADIVEETGTAEADDLRGLAGNDILIGGDGNDSLYGFEGSDRLVGGAGNDRLSGGIDRDADTLLGGEGGDWAYVYGGADEVILGNGFDSLSVIGLTDFVLAFGGADEDNLYLDADKVGGFVAAFSDGGIVVTGGEPNGQLRAEEFEQFSATSTVAGADMVLSGDASGIDLRLDGNDLRGATLFDLSGVTGAGATVTSWGTGDTMIGGAGDDVLTDDYFSLIAYGLDDPNGDADTLRGGAGDDTLSASYGDDELDGGDGADVLSGGSGDDRLIGGTGADLIEGGAGADLIYGDGVV